jgi:hypothetical protein
MTFVFKRLIWWASGAVMGAGGSLWAQRKVKKVVKAQVERVQETLNPANIAAATKGRVVHAIDEGRGAALRRERELQGRIADARTARSERRGAARAGAERGR